MGVREKQNVSSSQLLTPKLEEPRTEASCLQKMVLVQCEGEIPASGFLLQLSSPPARSLPSIPVMFGTTSLVRF